MPLVIATPYKARILSECGVFTIVSIDAVDDSFTISGDHTECFGAGETFEVTGTALNDGIYTVHVTSGSVYDENNDQSIVYVNENVVTETPPGGTTAERTPPSPVYEHTPATITTQGYVTGSTLKTRVYVQGNVVGPLGNNLGSGGSADVSGTTGGVNDGLYTGIDDLSYDPSTDRTTWTTESVFEAGDTNSQTCVSTILNTTPIATYINTSAGGSYSETPFTFSPTTVTGNIYEYYIRDISGDIRDQVGSGETIEISGTSAYDGTYTVLGVYYDDDGGNSSIELDSEDIVDPEETDITVDLPGTITSGDGPFQIASLVHDTYNDLEWVVVGRDLSALLSIGDAFIIENSYSSDGVYTIVDTSSDTFFVNRPVENEDPTPATGTKLNFGIPLTPVVYSPTSAVGDAYESYINFVDDITNRVGVGEEVEVSGTTSSDGIYTVINADSGDGGGSYIELVGFYVDPEETGITVDLPGTYVSGDGPFSVAYADGNTIQLNRKIDFSTVFAVGDYIKLEDTGNNNNGYYVIDSFPSNGRIRIEGDFPTDSSYGNLTKAPPALGGTPSSKIVLAGHKGNMSGFMPASSKIKIVNASDVDNNGWKTVDTNTGSQVTLSELLDDGDTNLSGGSAYVSNNKLIKTYSSSVTVDSAELQVSGVWDNLTNYVGQTLEISGATNPANNGTFTISGVRFGSASTYVTLTSSLVAGDANLLAGLANISLGTFTNTTTGFTPSEYGTQLQFDGPIAAPLSSLASGDRIVISGASYSQNNRSYIVQSVDDVGEIINVELDATCEHVKGSDLNLNSGTAVVKHSYVITSYTTATGSVGRLVLDGNLTDVFASGQTITIGGSSSNNGSKVVGAVSLSGAETHLYLTSTLVAGDANLSGGVAEIVTSPYPICNYATEHTPGQFIIENTNLAYLYPVGSSVTISGSSIPGDNGVKTVISSTFDTYNTILEVSDYIDGSGGGVVEYDIVVAGQSPTVGNAVDRQVREWGNSANSIFDDFVNTGSYASKSMDLSYIKNIKVGAIKRHYGMMLWCDGLPLKSSTHQIRTQLYKWDDNAFGGPEMEGSSQLVVSPASRIDYSQASYMAVQTLTDKRSVIIYNTGATPQGPRVALYGHNIDKDGATLTPLTGKRISTTTNTKCGPVTSDWGIGFAAATDSLQTVFPEYGSERVVVITGYGPRGIATVKVTADDNLVTRFTPCGYGGGQGVGVSTALAQVSKDTFIMTYQYDSYDTYGYIIVFQLVRESDGTYGVRFKGDSGTGQDIGGPLSGNCLDLCNLVGTDRYIYGRDSQTMTIATIPESYDGSSIKAIIAARRHMALFSINLTDGTPTRIGNWYNVITATGRGSHMFSPSISYNNGEFMLYYFGQTTTVNYAHHKLHRFSVNLNTGAFTEQSNTILGSLYGSSGLVNGQNLATTSIGLNGVFNGIRRARRKIVWYYSRGKVLIDGGTEINSTGGSNNLDVFYTFYDD